MTATEDPVTPAGGPLAGVRVIEFGHLISGPFAGQILGDLGADVIKCESPGGGDPMREWGTERTGGLPLWFATLGRNKRSITLDLRKPRGQEIARRLMGGADLVIENFRPGTMERWNLGYDELSALNPGLVMLRVTGFGQTGPYASRPGYGSLGEAMGGLRYLVGEPDRPPSRMGISIGDSLAGLFAVVGGLAALRERERSGRGQVVDVALYEAVLAVMESLVADAGVVGHVRERTGSILPGLAPSNVYRTADDRLLLVAANQDTIFGRLCTAMGQPELADDPRFTSHAARGANQALLDGIIQDWTGRRRADEIESDLERCAVPVGRLYTGLDMLQDPHFTARGSIVEVEDPDIGVVPMQTVMPRLSRTPGVVRTTAPRVGEHTRQVLQELLGVDDEEYAALEHGQVI